MRLRHPHPVVLAAALGALAGLAAAALLIAFAHQPEPYGYTSADRIASWLGIPARHWVRLASGWDWGWEEEERALFNTVSLAANGAFWGGASVAVWRRWVVSASFRRRELLAVALTAPLAALQWAVKIPFMGASPLQAAVFTLHLPGIVLLSHVGLCCGYDSSIVIRDWGQAGGYHPDALALALLFASNLIMYTVLLSVGAQMARWTRRVRGR